MKIVLASKNKHKIAELSTLLSETIPDIEVLSLDEVGITEDIEENGTTFAENALIKAKVAASTGFIGVGDDSGLTVDALKGEPGIYSARYAYQCTGENDHNDEANNKVLLERMKDIPNEQRQAGFVCAIACVHPDGRVIQVEGKVEGLLLREKQGENGFGYDPLLFYPPMHCTMAQMTAEQKNAISHRGKAIRLLSEQLKAWQK